MPPITIEHVEPDGNGGWLVEWRDDANLEGEPLIAHIHVTVGRAHEFARLMAHLKRPDGPARAQLERARDTLARDRGGTPRIPDGVTPYAVRDFFDFYEDHVVDCIDRVKLNVAGHAPHEVLEVARAGGAIEDRWKRVREEQRAIREFARGRMGNR